MKKALYLLLSIAICSSFKKEDDILSKEPAQEKVGRFDSSPFVWDYKSDPNNNKIFFGDLNINTNT